MYGSLKSSSDSEDGNDSGLPIAGGSGGPPEKEDKPDKPDKPEKADKPETPGKGGPQAAGGDDDEKGKGKGKDREKGQPVGKGKDGDDGGKFANARGRFKDAVGRFAEGGPPGQGFGDGDLGVVEHPLTGPETAALIAGGWGEGPAGGADDGFRNRGQRVSTYVAIAKALGYSASVGALQAHIVNFDEGEEAGAIVDGGVVDGGVVDGGIVDGDGGGWTAVNLDVDGDGIVTVADLEAALAAADAAADGGVIDGGGAVDGGVIDGGRSVAPGGRWWRG